MVGYKVPKGYKLVKEAQPIKTGLDYWKHTTKGFKVVENGLKYKAKNGKTYDAVKVSFEDRNTGKEKILILKSVRGGSVYTSKDF